MKAILRALVALVNALRWSNLRSAYAAELGRVKAEREARKPSSRLPH